MKKILVAVDGSLPSVHAARLAVDLAKTIDGAVTLIHVTPPTVVPGDVMLPPQFDLRESELAFGASILADVARAIEGTHVATLNLLGAPAEVIADRAVADNFDLVAVGNKGRSAVTRVLLGSVADRLVHICLRPVLVVR